MVEKTPAGSEGGHRLFATVMTVLMLTSVGLGAVTGTVAAEHDNGVGANYTVNLPNEKDHYPGEQGGKASIQHFATSKGGFGDADGFEELGFIVISSQAIDFSNCGTADTAAFGIDRNSDDAGTHTDENLLDHREDSSFNQHSIVVDFFDEGDLAGQPTYLNRTDQVVAVQQGCYVMPSEPGWYQINARVNGTTYSGNEKDITNIKSHYFYVCECASEEEAREKLGPPPSESSGSGDGGSGDGSSDTSTATATPTPTPTATPSDGGDDESTPQSTDDSSTSPTATSGGTPTADSPGTSSPTTTGSTSTDGPTTTEAVSATATSDGNQKVNTTTPTSGNGPGFGLVTAMFALAAAALLARRDR